MEIAHLGSFLAAYQQRNFTQAARSLHISQPALTNHIQALESEIGRPLFVRLARGVSPTATAHRLADEIIGPLDSLRTTATRFARSPSPDLAVLHLGGPSDALATSVLPAIAPLVSNGLSVHATSGMPEGLLNDLMDGSLDLMVSTKPIRRQTITVDVLFQETLALVASPRLQEQLGEGTPSRLAQFPLVAYDETAPLVGRYWRTVFEAHTVPKPRVVVEDLRAILEFLLRGVGWSVLPAYIVDHALDDQTLTRLHVPDVEPTNDLYLACLNSRRSRSYVKMTIDCLLGHYGGMT